MKINNKHNKNNLRRVSADERAMQKAKADAIQFLNKDSLMESLGKIRRIENPKASEITENSRVNEQSVFAALVENSLKQVDEKLGANFEAAFSKELEELKANEDSDSLLKAARRGLNSLVNDNLLSRYAARKIRSLAVGKSQLDDNRNKLSVEKEDPESSETPLRAVKTALNKIAENLEATALELSEYRKQGRARLQ